MILEILLFVALFVGKISAEDFYDKFESSNDLLSTDAMRPTSTDSLSGNQISSDSAASISVSTKLTPGDFGSIAWNKFNNFMDQEIPGRGLEPIFIASSLNTETLNNLITIIESLERTTRNRKLKSDHPDNYLYNHHKNLEHATRNLQKLDLKVWQLNLRQLIDLRTDGILNSQNNVADVWFTKHFLEGWKKFQLESKYESSDAILNLIWQRSTDYVGQALPTTNGLAKDTSPRTSIADISEWCQMWDVVRRGELSFPFHSVAKRNFIQFQGNIKSAFKYGVAMPTYLGLIKEDLKKLYTLRLSIDESSVQQTLRSIRNMPQSELSPALLESFKTQTLGLDLYQLSSNDLLSDQLAYIYHLWENSNNLVNYQIMSKRLVSQLTQSDLAQSVNSVIDGNNKKASKELEKRLKSAQKGLVATEKVYTKALQNGLNESYFEFREGRIALKPGVLRHDISNPKVRADFNEQFDILSDSIRKHRVTREEYSEDLSVLDKRQGNSSYRKQYFKMLENIENIDFVSLDKAVKGVVYDAPNGLFVRDWGNHSETREVTKKKIGKLANDTQVSVKHIYIDRITGHAIFYLIDASSEAVKTQLYPRFRENSENYNSFLAADYVKLNEDVDFLAYRSETRSQELTQQQNQQLKTRLSKIITDLEISLRSFEELNFDPRKENHFVKYQANGWNPFGKQKQSVTFVPSALGMILARDLHQILLSIQEKEDIQISNEEDALVSVENLFESESFKQGLQVNCAWRYSVCIDSVTQRLTSLQNSIKLISVD